MAADPKTTNSKPTATRGDLALQAARAISRIGIENPYADITASVTELLDGCVGMLGRFIDIDGEPSMETLGHCVHGELVENSQYPLAGTPCETVNGREFVYYPTGVAERFPLIIETYGPMESYAAYPLVDSHQNVLGLLTVMCEGPLCNESEAETLLRIFADRAVAEIERDQVSQALQVSENQYQAIFNASLDGMVLVQPDGTIVDVNIAIERMYGYSRENLRGRNVIDMLAPGRREAADSFIQQVLDNGYAETKDIAFRRDGTRFDIEPRAVLMDYRNEPHILATVRDISNDLKRDRALLHSENLLRATVDAGLDCIIVMDENGEVMEFNPAAERCFGFAKDDVLGKKLSDLIIPERYREAHESGLRHFLETGDGPYLDKRIEVTATRASGEEFPVELTIGVARSESGMLFIGYLRDITERRDAEQQRQILEAQLRQAQKMEALGHLTGGIAHDFNNILTSVLGYVDMATNTDLVAGDARLSRYLLRARLSSERARDLVQQMLTFSRGQQGQKRPTRLQSIVEEGMYLLESTLPASVTIETQFASDLPKITVDPVHIEQVLVNLCINARDAMDGSGHLQISINRVRPHETVCSSCHQSITGEYLELAVTDDGPGLEPALAERIFEPFFSTKEAGKGSGMGLATVHGIVHEYGGHIHLHSEPGEGAVFRVFLPIPREQTAEGQVAQETTEAIDQTPLEGNVLIVDDNLVVAEFLDELLSSWGLRVTPFANAQAALKNFKASGDEFDLVITDQTMPDMTGLELAKSILEHKPDMPVILYTGFSETLTESIAVDAGVKALVYKPLDIPAFRRTIQPFLRAPD